MKSDLNHPIKNNITSYEFFTKNDIKYFHNENIKQIFNNRKKTDSFKNRDHTKDFLEYFTENYLKIGHSFIKKFEGHTESIKSIVFWKE